MGAIPIFQVLKIFPVMSCNWFQLQYLCTKIWKNKDLMNLYWCYLMWDLWIINRDIWVHPMNVERSLKGESFILIIPICATMKIGSLSFTG